MSENIDTTRHPFSLPRVWRRRLFFLAGGLASLLAIYALAGFFLAPYLIIRYVPQYAAEQLHVQVRLEKVRINPFLFTCEAEGLSLQADEDEPFFSAQRLFVDFELESLFRRAWTFGDLVMENPTLRLVIGADGRLNLAKLGTSQPHIEKSADTGEKPTPRLLLKHLALSDGTMRVSDHSTSKPTEIIINPIALEFNNISTLPEHRGAFAVSASLPEGGSLGWQGEMSLQPISATGTIEIKDFKPATIWNFFRGKLNLAPPTGTAQLTASYSFSFLNGEPALQVNPLNLSIRGLALSEKGTGQPFLKLDSLTAAGGQIDFATHRIALPSITITGGRIATLVNKKGVGNWQRLVETAPQSPAKKRPIIHVKPAPAEPPPWRVAIESFVASDLALQYSDASRPNPISLKAKLADLSLGGSSIDLGQQEAVIKRLALTGGGASLTQSPDALGKPINPPKTKPKTAPETTQAEISPRKSPQKSPWKLMLAQGTVSGFHLGFADKKSTPPLAYDLNNLQAELNDFGNPGGKPITFAAQAGIRQGGTASLSGSMTQSGGQTEQGGVIEAQITISQMNLMPLASLVTEHATLTLASGNFSTDANVRYAGDGSPPSLTLKGDAKIGDLLLNEETSGKRFLVWKELGASGLDFGLNPGHLAIKEIRLLEPGTTITIFKDKSLNLAQIRRDTDEDKTEKPPFPVAIERVRIKDGVVDFSDFSLILPFVTRVTQFKGACVDISTKPASRASLKFEGRVGEFGQAKANGSLVPSNPKQFTDIKVSFRNVAMSPLSPYSATFAGRKIESGKLNLDLGYTIKNSELMGENSVVLEDFTLGERVESPNAMDLPLDLAIALLTDSEGKIDIAVPISGNLDHPEFSYGHVIRQALLNLLTKVVTSPFRALGALFGSQSENMDTILFEPGRAEVAPPEQEKLKKIAEALGKKEQLKLTVHGGFEPGLDGKALKTSQLRRTLVKKLGAKAGPMAYDNAKTQSALEEYAGDKLAAFQSGYEEMSGKKVQRVNPILGLFGQGSEDYDFYRALFEYLVETVPLSQAELEALAEKRGQAIVQEITGWVGVDAARIIIGNPVQTEEQDNSVPARLELSLR
ncbi:MAG: DUF748 domain-containing protein [Desulfurivibrio sp.]|nr:DUF748 domain-containing protein [Desulfurivibrio sp.]MBU4118569.1 DUF748 domain-containing protein [Pseudomonadota bacterium]